jgi:hypothetical protein
MASCLHRAQASNAPVGTRDFEFINIARPKDSASKNLRRAVRSHVMRKYHNMNQGQIVSADRNRDHSESAKRLTDDPSKGNRLRMTLALSMSTKETEPPCRLYPHYIECNSDPADPGKTKAEFARSAGCNERSPSRLQDPPNAIRSTPTHPFHGAPQVDPYSLKQIQFCELVSSLEHSPNLRSIRA